jgi:hypothetical protein
MRNMVRAAANMIDEPHATWVGSKGSIQPVMSRTVTTSPTSISTHRAHRARVPIAGRLYPGLARGSYAPLALRSGTGADMSCLATPRR